MNNYIWIAVFITDDGHASCDFVKADNEADARDAINSNFIDNGQPVPEFDEFIQVDVDEL